MKEQGDSGGAAAGDRASAVEQQQQQRQPTSTTSDDGEQVAVHGRQFIAVTLPLGNGLVESAELMLDNGAMLNLVTAGQVEAWGLSRNVRESHKRIRGVGDATPTVQGRINLRFLVAAVSEVLVLPVSLAMPTLEFLVVDSPDIAGAQLLIGIAGLRVWQLDPLVNRPYAHIDATAHRIPYLTETPDTKKVLVNRSAAAQWWRTLEFDREAATTVKRSSNQGEVAAVSSLVPLGDESDLLGTVAWTCESMAVEADECLRQSAVELSVLRSDLLMKEYAQRAASPKLKAMQTPTTKAEVAAAYTPEDEEFCAAAVEALQPELAAAAQAGRGRGRPMSMKEAEARIKEAQEEATRLHNQWDEEFTKHAAEAEEENKKKMAELVKELCLTAEKMATSAENAGLQVPHVGQMLGDAAYQLTPDQLNEFIAQLEKLLSAFYDPAKVPRNRAARKMPYTVVLEFAEPEVAERKAAEKAGQQQQNAQVKRGYRGFKPILDGLHRNYPKDKLEALLRQLKEMARALVVEPGKDTSKCVHACVLAKKADGTWRFCIDFKPLNAQLKEEVYALPRIEDVCDLLAREGGYYSKLDLKSAYWQVPIHEDSREYTGFFVPGAGIWQFRVLAFGISSAVALFQRTMEKILAPLLYKGVIVYLDDMVIYGRTLEELLKRQRMVFALLQAWDLRVAANKCQFLTTEVPMLGRLVSKDKVAENPAHLQAVREFPKPETIAQLGRFLGMAGWHRRVVPRYAQRCAPLNHMLAQAVAESGRPQAKTNNFPLKWTEAALAAFDDIRNALSTSPVCVVPDMANTTGRFTLMTDAHGSDAAEAGGIGGLLYYRGDDGVDRMVGAFSRLLRSRELSYGATKFECLALVETTRFFEDYLRRAREIHTLVDHEALKYLVVLRDQHHGQLARWALWLSGFDLRVFHRAGAEHVVPDTLSRAPLPFTAPVWQGRKLESLVLDSGDTVELDALGEERDLVGAIAVRGGVRKSTTISRGLLAQDLAAFATRTKKKADVLVLDPPYHYHNNKNKPPYKGVSNEELLALPIVDLLADDAVVLLWTPGPQAGFAHQLLNAWGLTFKNYAFVWMKYGADEQGPVGAATSQKCEYVLLATRGNALQKMVTQNVAEQVILGGRREHSRKPEEFWQRLQQLVPGVGTDKVTTIELFARQRRPHVVAFGNELDLFAPVAGVSTRHGGQKHVLVPKSDKNKKKKSMSPPPPSTSTPLLTSLPSLSSSSAETQRQPASNKPSSTSSASPNKQQTDNKRNKKKKSQQDDGDDQNWLSGDVSDLQKPPSEHLKAVVNAVEHIKPLLPVTTLTDPVACALVARLTKPTDTLHWQAKLEGPSKRSFEVLVKHGIQGHSVEWVPVETKIIVGHAAVAANLRHAEMLRLAQWADKPDTFLSPHEAETWFKAFKKKTEGGDGEFPETLAFPSLSVLVAGKKLTYLVTSSSWYSQSLVELIHVHTGHMGAAACIAHLRQLGWYMPRVHELVALVCRRCSVCASRNGHPAVKWRASTSESDRLVPMGVNHVVHLDFAGPFKKANGEDCYLLFVTCEFSGWVEVAIVDAETAAEAARVFKDHWVCRFGAPVFVSTDQGPAFTSQMLLEVTAQMGISRIFTAPYHPRSDGANERSHAELYKAVAKLVAQRGLAPSEWSAVLHEALFVMRSATRERTGLSPAEVVYGFPLKPPEGALQSELAQDLCSQQLLIWLDYKEYFQDEALDDWTERQVVERMAQLRRASGESMEKILQALRRYLWRLDEQQKAAMLAKRGRVLKNAVPLHGLKQGDFVRLWQDDFLKRDRATLNHKFAPDRWSLPWRVVRIFRGVSLLVAAANDPLRTRVVSGEHVKKASLDPQTRQKYEQLYQDTLEQKKKLLQLRRVEADNTLEWKTESSVRDGKRERFTVSRLVQLRGQGPLYSREVLVEWVDENGGKEMDWQPVSIMAVDVPELWAEWLRKNERKKAKLVKK